MSRPDVGDRVQYTTNFIRFVREPIDGRVARRVGTAVRRRWVGRIEMLVVRWTENGLSWESTCEKRHLKTVRE